MGIGEQFAGLDMKNLIGGPLTAAADASVQLAQSTANFINQVGFDAENKVRKVNFNFEQKKPDVDGSINSSEMKVEVPMLAIVPIPNLQIDEVNILFDMEVKQCEKSENSLDVGATLTGSARFGPVNVSISGSVSVHNANTRSSDNSAKYHVDLRATNHGIPEGLARVLDMMAASVSPTLVSSRAVDEAGNELDGPRKSKNLQLRALREKKFQLERSVQASTDVFDSKLKALISKSESIQNAERLEWMKPGNSSTDEGEMTPEQKKAELEKEQKAESELEKINNNWSDFKTNIKSIILSTSQNSKIGENGIAENVGKLSEKTTLYISEPFKADKDFVINELETLFANAVSACNDMNAAIKAQEENNVTYNKLMLSN